MADPSVAEAFTRLVDLMARLRAPGGCPWDREQTPASLRPYLLEEVYEVLEAIDAGDAAHLRDELGDLLLQIVFQSQLAAEAGRFTVAEVAHAIADKLVRRHPHVFGDVEVRDAGEVVRNWRRIKAEERRTAGEDGDLFAGVPAASPALVRAEQLGEKAGHVGLDWPDARGVLEKLREETAELEAALAAGDRAASEHELGDLLLAAASLGRRRADAGAGLARARQGGHQGRAAPRQRGPQDLPPRARGGRARYGELAISSSAASKQASSSRALLSSRSSRRSTRSARSKSAARPRPRLLSTSQRGMPSRSATWAGVSPCSTSSATWSARRRLAARKATTRSGETSSACSWRSTRAAPGKSRRASRSVSSSTLWERAEVAIARTCSASMRAPGPTWSESLSSSPASTPSAGPARSTSSSTAAGAISWPRSRARRTTQGGAPPASSSGNPKPARARRHAPRSFRRWSGSPATTRTSVPPAPSVGNASSTPA